MAVIAESPSVIDELYRDFPVARTAGGTPYMNIADEYVAWLSFANAGMLNKGNLLAFDYAIRNLPSSNPIVLLASRPIMTFGTVGVESGSTGK